MDTFKSDSRNIPSRTFGRLSFASILAVPGVSPLPVGDVILRRLRARYAGTPIPSTGLRESCSRSRHDVFTRQRRAARRNASPKIRPWDAVEGWVASARRDADSSARLRHRQVRRAAIVESIPGGPLVAARIDIVGHRPGRRPTWASSERKDSIMDETHDVDVLNQGLQGEYFGISAYDAALGSGLLSDRVTAVARQFQADHRAHAQTIRNAIERLGGRADLPKTWKEYSAMYPPPKLASEAEVLSCAA